MDLKEVTLTMPESIYEQILELGATKLLGEEAIFLYLLTLALHVEGFERDPGLLPDISKD